MLSVDDPDGDSSYTVAFESPTLTNCVGVATTGRGEPGGAAAGGVAFGEFVDLSAGGVVQVSLFDDSAAGVRKDGSFMIAVFC